MKQNLLNFKQHHENYKKKTTQITCGKTYNSTYSHGSGIGEYPPDEIDELDQILKANLPEEEKLVSSSSSDSESD